VKQLSKKQNKGAALLTKLSSAKGRQEAEETLKTIYQLPITILPATDTTVLAATSLKMDYAISFK
jgi:hypothetical protein